MLSHTRMGVPYEYTRMGRPIRVWANIRIWGRTYIRVQQNSRKQPTQKISNEARLIYYMVTKQSIEHKGIYL